MKTKKSASSAPGERVRKKRRPTIGHKIDFSDIPELTDQQLKRGRRVGRPNAIVRKIMISIRLDPKIVADLRHLAELENKPYQTLLQEILVHGIRRKKAA